MTEEQRQSELGILIDLRTQLQAIEAIFADRAKLDPLPPSATVIYGELTLTTADGTLLANAATALTNSYNTQLDTALTASQTARQVPPI